MATYAFNPGTGLSSGETGTTQTGPISDEERTKKFQELGEAFVGNSGKKSTSETKTTKTTTDVAEKAVLDQAMKTGQTALDPLLNADSPELTPTEVSKLKVSQSQLIDPATGKLKQPAATYKAATGKVAKAGAADQVDAATYDATMSGDAVGQVADATQAVQGQVSNEALAQGATMDPNQLSQLGLEAAQIGQAQTVQAPQDRTLQDGELVDGSSVNQTKVDSTLDAVKNAVQTADPTKQATVAGQMEGLMSQFEGGATPAWAAGALRNAQAALAARGLSASSLAGQALVQAAMEAAVPIAQADAQTHATFELQNLSNRQQAAMLAAEQRATFLGQEFDQNFQTKVLNAATIKEIANKNYDTSVQIALENARMAQTVDIANLDAKNAKILADAAALTQIESQNLSNMQQAQLQNAQAFLDMDMANADREQQTALFNSQARINAIMSDQAASNAAKQFNAESENETNQFMATLQSQIEQFNASQKNSMTQFNVSERNAAAKFKAEQETRRREFNATASLEIAKANKAWRQQVALENTRAVNEANRLDAQNSTTLTLAEYNAQMQGYRDLMSYALNAVESEKDRALEIITTQMTAEAQMAIAKMEGKSAQTSALWTAAGTLAAEYISRKWGSDD